MITCAIKKNTMFVEISYGINEGIIMKVDTGSPVSLLSKFHITQIFGYPQFVVNKVISEDSSKYSKVYFNTYNNKGVVSCIPCRMSNVNIGGETVGEFNFYLNLSNDEDITPLLGMDFLNRCNGNLIGEKYLTLYLTSSPVNVIIPECVMQINEIRFKEELEHESNNVRSNIVRDKLFLDTSLPEII